MHGNNSLNISGTMMILSNAPSPIPPCHIRSSRNICRAFRLRRRHCRHSEPRSLRLSRPAPLPRYNHHVDDNMNGDISEYMERAASASIISLYEIVGYPDGRIPDPVSWDKFHSTYGHLRRVVGWLFNTRTQPHIPTTRRQTLRYCRPPQVLAQ